MPNLHRKHVMCKEHLASVDGDVRSADCSRLPSDWHAINYVECLDSGKCYAEIEYVQDPFAQPWEFKGNTRMTKEEFEKHSGCSHVFSDWHSKPDQKETVELQALDVEMENIRSGEEYSQDGLAERRAKALDRKKAIEANIVARKPK